MRKWAAGLAAVAWLMLSPLPAEAWLASDAFSIHARSTTSRIPSSTVVTLDGVTLEITTSFLSNLQFATPDPGSAIQVATAVEREPLFRELSITAVPFGVSPPTESVPVARAGGEEAYRAALRAYRREQGGHPQAGAILHLFGEPVAGSTSVVDLRVSGEARVPVSITEWVVEAGPRLWIVRASRQLEGELDSARSASPSSLAFPDSPIGSADLSQPSTSLASAQRQKPPVTGASAMTASAPDLPSPPWWGGECDATHFYSATQVFPYPLGAEYRGLKACGPRPWFDQDVWALVDFGAGSLQIEWQCPELSMRFLYLAYGILPYPANGNQVVDNYGGELLEKEWNCTEGRAPQPDDVLSYGATTTYGHTSVVVASDVDSTGDGTIQVIEQNGSETGHNTLAVNDWCVTGYTDIIGWLHEPGWSVEIYGDDSLIDPCATGDRAGTYVFETWGEGAPAEGCPDDDFSVRFSRTITFPGGDYTFGLGYDEGARLKIDGETVVDGWGSSSQHYVTRHLDPGEHHVTVEAYDGFGTAALSAFWWGPGFELARETRDGSQWYAEYWGNPALWWEPAVMVREGSGSLSHAWSSGGPADSLPGDHFSARFRRQVSFDAAGRWRFDLFADDGVRFWIDDQLIVNEWQPQRDWFTPTVTLGVGPHELAVEYYEDEGVADIGLDWERISDVVTPTGWVTAPVDGATIEACPITIEAEVGQDLGLIDRVEFHASYDDSWHYLGDDDTAPFSWLWQCQSVHSRTARLAVHVWDKSGSEFVDLDGDVSVTLDHLEYSYLPLILKWHSGAPWGLSSDRHREARSSEPVWTPPRQCPVEGPLASGTGKEAACPPRRFSTSSRANSTTIIRPPAKSQALTSA